VVDSYEGSKIYCEVPLPGNAQHIHPIFGIKISGKNNPHPSVIPAKLCQVIPGQLYKQKVPEYPRVSYRQGSQLLED